MNCANSTLRHCCTFSCHNDSDCTISGECNAEHSQCRLNSATVDWSKCSQDSPCADGEGDCDHHTDCEGTLLCGNDNCANGPTGMDCCHDGIWNLLFLAHDVGVWNLIKLFITAYIVIEDSAISCDFVRSASECESAAHELGLSDVTVVDDGQNGVTYDPPFCYFEGGSLKFNNFGTNTGPCTTSDKCLCRQNDFCAKTPCSEGQGDCDDDTECEGSLICGHLNCMNSAVTDCCAQK